MAYTPPAPGSGGSGTSTSASNPFGASQERANFPVLTSPPPTAIDRKQEGNDITINPKDANGQFTMSHDLTGQLFAMAPEQIANLQTQLRLAGYAPSTLHSDGVVDSATVNGYQDLLADVGQYNQNGQFMTPDSLLSQKIAGANQAALAGAATGATTSQTFDLTDPNAARVLVKNSLENRLGRTANPDEINQFYASLHAAQLAQPGRETDTYGAGGNPYVPKERVSYSTRPDPQAAADAFALGTQGRANEAGAQSELGFMSVLQRLVGNTRSPV